MMSAIHSTLAAWLAAGGERIGEVSIFTRPEGGYRLTHWEQAAPALSAAPEPPLILHTTPEDARIIAIYDDAGEFRPLKTAPNLRHGWVLELHDVDALALAIDFFYPAALGVYTAWAADRLTVTPLRDTLNRQSGMYAITKKASDAEINHVVAECCKSAGGCLKSILWEIAPGQPVTSLPVGKFQPTADQLRSQPVGAFPLLCNEGCNLLVAAIRAELKKE